MILLAVMFPNALERIISLIDWEDIEVRKAVEEAMKKNTVK